MKKFTTAEIRDLLNRVYREEISFSEMVDMINNRVSKASELKFKNGDFVYEDGRIIIFKSYPNNYHCLYYPPIGEPFFDDNYGIDFTAKSFRRATEEEKQVLLDVLTKKGKRWNAEKLCIEDIPKFKKGDKVRIKEGVSSETHGCVYPYFTDFLSRYMGKVMTVEEYITTDIGEYVTTYEAKRGNHPFGFSEDWLEPYEGLKDGDFVAGLGCIFILHKPIDCNSAQFYVLYAKTNGKLLYHKTYFNLGGIDKLELATESEEQELIDVLAKEGKRWNAEKRCVEDIPKELKKGDLAIFWDSDSSEARIGVYNKFYDCLPFPYIDHIGNCFRNAVKFESTEQFEKLINGEL